MERTAFCPGHVTGFFEICRSDEILSTGSRGAGFCLSLGATSRVTIEDASEQEIGVRIAGSDAQGEVTREAIRHLVREKELSVQIFTTLDLPMRQGFGMSAAGSLSAALAVADMLDLPRQKAFEAAHMAEVTCGSGLGDISAIHGGGITIRRRAGLPPRGEVLRIDGAPEVVLSVVGADLPTKTVLSDPQKAAAINVSGFAKVEELAAEPTLEKLMQLSEEFTRETGLASKEVLEAMDTACRAGKASMAMLGNSVFALGDMASLRHSLSELGEVWACPVDTRGPRIVR